MSLMTFQFLLFAFLFLAAFADKNLSGNGWKYYCYGSCDSDAHTPSVGGTLNMGGGTDVDGAFQWLIKNSGGGDILVLRTTDDPDYNPWIYGLGKVHSVATLALLQAEPPSHDPFVIQTIRACEGLWFAGGDQWDYYSFWRNTPVQAAVQFLVDTKRVTIGGTSAGMAVMADFVYTAEFDTVTSAEALQNPFDRRITLASDFIRAVHMRRTTTDMHFAQRDRFGRSITFLARVVQTTGHTRHIVLACDESSSLAIEDITGIGTVITLPDSSLRKPSDDTCRRCCYVMQANGQPLVCKPNTPLTFGPVTVTRLRDGDVFDMMNWRSDNAAQYYVSVKDGILVGLNGTIY